MPDLFLATAASDSGSSLMAAPLGANVAEVVSDFHDTTIGEEDQFKDFARKFHKVYLSSEERETHFAAFKTTLAIIREENAKGHGYVLGVTQFADMTPEEFGDMFNQPMSLPKGIPVLGRHQYSGGDLPNSTDWRELGAVTDVKNQANCGSCWSFATTGVLEGAWKIATGKLVPMSEQQLIDCTSNTMWGDMGCKGGAIERAVAYLASGKGMCTEDSYSYQAVQGTCQESSCNVAIPALKVLGFMQVARADGDEALMEAVAQNGPVAIAIEADKKMFMHYKGGIMHKSCGVKVDHAVLLVGYGTQGNSTDDSIDVFGKNKSQKGEYWILKNSWGEEWGEKGFGRLERGKRGTGECGIKTDPVFVKVDGSAPDPPPFIAMIPFVVILCMIVMVVQLFRRLICPRLRRQREPRLLEHGATADGAAVPAAAPTATAAGRAVTAR